MFLSFSKGMLLSNELLRTRLSPFVDKQTEKARFETGLGVMIIVIVMTTVLLNKE